MTDNHLFSIRNLYSWKTMTSGPPSVQDNDSVFSSDSERTAVIASIASRYESGMDGMDFEGIEDEGIITGEDLALPVKIDDLSKKLVAFYNETMSPRASKFAGGDSESEDSKRRNEARFLKVFYQVLPSHTLNNAAGVLRMVHAMEGSGGEGSVHGLLNGLLNTFYYDKVARQPTSNTPAQMDRANSTPSYPCTDKSASNLESRNLTGSTVSPPSQIGNAPQVALASDWGVDMIAKAAELSDMNANVNLLAKHLELLHEWHEREELKEALNIINHATSDELTTSLEAAVAELPELPKAAVAQSGEFVEKAKGETNSVFERLRVDVACERGSEELEDTPTCVATRIEQVDGSLVKDKESLSTSDNCHRECFQSEAKAVQVQVPLDVVTVQVENQTSFATP